MSCPEILNSYISECGFNNDIFEIAELLEDEDMEMINAYLGATGEVLTAETIQKAKDRFCGYFENEIDLSYYFAYDLGILENVPNNIKMYFDHQAHGRDLGISRINFNNYYFY